MRERIKKAINDALVSLEVPLKAPFVVERPRAMEHGDYATNAALSANASFVVYKGVKRSPMDVAEELRQKLEGKIEGVEKIEVMSPGFINFFLTREELVPQPQEVPQIYAGRKIMVEYTDPNPFKEFHIGHLMSNAIGESIARLLELSGAKVIRANYQGDVGLHVAKAMWGYLELAKERDIENLSDDKKLAQWARAYVFGAQKYEVDEVVKADIDLLNKSIYNFVQNKEENNPLFKLYLEGRSISLDHFEYLYNILGTKFDKDLYFFESETGPRGLAIVNSHPEVFEASEGAIIFRGEDQGLHTRVFVNKFGLPTYEAKDLGLAEIKKERAKFDESITITASEQKEYFKVVLAALHKVHPEWKSEFRHITHGMMRFSQGKMSSRLGNVVTGETLLSTLGLLIWDLVDKAGKKGRMDMSTMPIAVAAVKYAILKQASGKDIVFDPEQSLSFQGDSGPYLQYARVRAISLLHAAQEAGIKAGTGDAPKEATTLERILLHYSAAVERAAREMEPHYVTTYLTELASAFNSWYASERIIEGNYPHYGVLLVRAFEKTMSQGLQVLGIPAPEEM